MWRVSSITFAVALAFFALGRYLDSQTDADEGANIGAGVLGLLGWGVGALALLFLVGAVVGDLARDGQEHDRSDADE